MQCAGCKNRDVQVEKLRFENSLLKDVIENHKKTISALESQVNDHQKMQVQMKESKLDILHGQFNEEHFQVLD